MSGWNYGQLLVHSTSKRTVFKSPLDEILSMLSMTDEELENWQKILISINNAK